MTRVEITISKPLVERIMQLRNAHANPKTTGCCVYVFLTIKEESADLLPEDLVPFMRVIMACCHAPHEVHVLTDDDPSDKVDGIGGSSPSLTEPNEEGRHTDYVLVNKAVLDRMTALKQSLPNPKTLECASYVTCAMLAEYCTDTNNREWILPEDLDDYIDFVFNFVLNDP